MNMKGTVFQPRVLQLNLHDIIRLPAAQQMPRQKKSGNVPARDSNPRSSTYKAGAQTVRPPAPADIPRCN